MNNSIRQVGVSHEKIDDASVWYENEYENEYKYEDEDYPEHEYIEEPSTVVNNHQSNVIKNNNNPAGDQLKINIRQEILREDIKKETNEKADETLTDNHYVQTSNLPIQTSSPGRSVIINNNQKNTISNNQNYNINNKQKN